MLLAKRVDLEKDFYKNKLLEMGYFKTPDGKQLYELTLSELTQIYENERWKLKQNGVKK